MGPNEENGSNIRGDIQQGISGDKKPGSDPATAPLETDSEAAGEPLGPDHVRIARQDQFHPDGRDWQGSHAEAMRPFESGTGKAPARRRRPWLLIFAGTLVVVAVWLALV